MALADGRAPIDSSYQVASCSPRLRRPNPSSRRSIPKGSTSEDGATETGICWRFLTLRSNLA